MLLHVASKKKFIRGNQAPFMTRNLRRQIYTRSRFRNKFCKDPTKENEKLCKKQRNKCVAFTRICIKEYFHNITYNNIVTNKKFNDHYINIVERFCGENQLVLQSKVNC